MMIGALGDIHGEFDTVQEIMRRHADVPFWLQVGDVASNDGEHFTPAAPLYWIKGNNEDFDVVAAADGGPSARADAALSAQRRPASGGQRGASRALGGTFAPSWYNAPASALPPSQGHKTTTPSVKLGKSRDDKRRHFVQGRSAGLQGA